MVSIASAVQARLAPTELLGSSPAIMRVNELVRRAASLSGGTLLTAEAGIDVVGVAHAIHDGSANATAPFVVLLCDGADGVAIERALFGAASATAATDLEPVGADSHIARARGGTLFLQQVSDLPAGAQSRLARIARDGEVRIDGAIAVTGVRLLASAPPGIDADVQANRFRVDLYRRLSTVRIDLPPLRERLDDLPVIAVRLIEEICAADERTPPAFTQAALALLGALTWPGNLAELRQAITRALAGTRDETIQIEQLLPVVPFNRAPGVFHPTGNLREARLRFERDYIAAVLQHHNWKVAAAAETLGIQRPNLYRKARQLGIPVARAAD